MRGGKLRGNGIRFRTSCDLPANSANVSETVTVVVCPCSSSSKLFSGIFLMNKNGQHVCQYLMIFHFGITIKIGHGL